MRIFVGSQKVNAIIAAEEAEKATELAAVAGEEQEQMQQIGIIRGTIPVIDFDQLASVIQVLAVYAGEDLEALLAGVREPEHIAAAFEHLVQIHAVLCEEAGVDAVLGGADIQIGEVKAVAVKVYHAAEAVDIVTDIAKGLTLFVRRVEQPLPEVPQTVRPAVYAAEQIQVRAPGAESGGLYVQEQRVGGEPGQIQIEVFFNDLHID